MIARLGYLTGLGRTTQEIADEIGGITFRQVQHQRYRLGLPSAAGRTALPVPLSLSNAERKRLERLARKSGLSAEEWLRRIAVCAIDDDLYVAVTDGRFD